MKSGGNLCSGTAVLGVLKKEERRAGKEGGRKEERHWSLFESFIYARLIVVARGRVVQHSAGR